MPSEIFLAFLPLSLIFLISTIYCFKKIFFSRIVVHSIEDGDSFKIANAGEYSLWADIRPFYFIDIFNEPVSILDEEQNAYIELHPSFANTHSTSPRGTKLLLYHFHLEEGAYMFELSSTYSVEILESVRYFIKEKHSIFFHLLLFFSMMATIFSFLIGLLFGILELHLL